MTKQFTSQYIKWNKNIWHKPKLNSIRKINDMETIGKKYKNQVEKVAGRPHWAYKSVKNSPKTVQEKKNER